MQDRNRIDGWAFLKKAVENWKIGSHSSLIECALYCRLSLEGRIEEYKNSREIVNRKIKPDKLKSAILELDKLMHTNKSIVEIHMGGTLWYYTPIKEETTISAMKLGNVLHYEQARFQKLDFVALRSELKGLLLDLIYCYLGNLAGTPYIDSESKGLRLTCIIRPDSVEYWRSQPEPIPPKISSGLDFRWHPIPHLPDRYLSDSLMHLWRATSLEAILGG